MPMCVCTSKILCFVYLYVYVCMLVCLHASRPMNFDDKHNNLSWARARLPHTTHITITYFSICASHAHQSTIRYHTNERTDNVAIGSMQRCQCIAFHTLIMLKEYITYIYIYVLICMNIRALLSRRKTIQKSCTVVKFFFHLRFWIRLFLLMICSVYLWLVPHFNAVLMNAIWLS